MSQMDPDGHDEVSMHEFTAYFTSHSLSNARLSPLRASDTGANEPIGGGRRGRRSVVSRDAMPHSMSAVKGG